MSIPVKQTVSCPKCGKDIEFTMWQSINNEMSFAMKDIISGKLFEVECKNCGLRTHVNYPILVNDMEHNVMIWYTYPDGIEEAEKALVPMKKMYNGHLRIVTDQADLREKVAIFNAPTLEAAANHTGLSGTYYWDAKLANAQCGFSQTPAGYVWHHVEDMQTMILVPQDLHSIAMGGMSHTGGASLIKAFLGL